MSKTPGGRNTPSEEISLHKDMEWNPAGLNYFYQDNNKPISHVKDASTIQKVNQSYLVSLVIKQSKV